ncbi:unnamed protein product [Leptidea sinapis]|uniref:Uncharacterized protein n=1 Tax=Leptidea sinapis TaxID=189913 RepID=A0A5E4Q5I0_9NEOP|nr:unnamed protein product [Leptidea sinapis]
MSPPKKKTKVVIPINNKRENDCDERPRKRSKREVLTEDVQSRRRKNFIKACEQVSYNAYFDYNKRLHLISLPTCLNIDTCVHQDFKNKTDMKQIPGRIEEAFKIEMKSNIWWDALEVCFLCITPNQYLSRNILMDNAHEDTTSNYTISSLLDRCRHVLSLNFNMHPPCHIKSIRKCYVSFLTSPMDLKQNTFTNRTSFGCEKGIVKYCFNRLEYELSIESPDGALVEKTKNTPEEMKQSVQGLHWQKEKFEIFELLERSDRIERLMAVLHSIIELLQFDLAIWHSRYTNNSGSHIMRSHKPFMAHILWSNNILYTGAVTTNCRQILKLFVYFVHLKYPERHINTLMVWLNAVIQTFYMCENNSSGDYPNTGKYCSAFANEFYKIIAELPPKSIIRVLERINPIFMRSLIGQKHIQNILSICHDEDIIKIFLNFMLNSQWQSFPIGDPIQVPESLVAKHIKPSKLLKYLAKLTRNVLKSNNNLVSEAQDGYAKYDRIVDLQVDKFDQNHIITSIYVAFHAYLEAYSIPKVQETLDTLNKMLYDDSSNNREDLKSYSVSETFIKKYRSIFQSLQELMHVLQNKKRDDEYSQS